VAPCRSCVNRCFGGTFRLHLQGRKIRSHLLTLVPRSWIFLPWRRRWYVLPKRLFTQDLHGATSQKTAFFVNYLVHKNTLLVPIMSYINPVNILTSYFFKIHLNIILLSMHRFSKLFLPCRFSDQKSVYISDLSRNIPHIIYVHLFTDSVRQHSSYVQSVYTCIACCM
jgi:hypothetical protein